MLDSLRALRAELPRLEALCDLYEERARVVPHRTEAILLELSLARRLIQAHRDWHRDWVDDVERAWWTGSGQPTLEPRAHEHRDASE